MINAVQEKRAGGAKASPATKGKSAVHVQGEHEMAQMCKLLTWYKPVDCMEVSAGSPPSSLTATANKETEICST